jgi:hypothetical protein
MKAVRIDPEQKAVSLEELPSAEGLVVTGLTLPEGDVLLLRKTSRQEGPADLSRIHQRYGVVKDQAIFSVAGRHFRGTGFLVHPTEGAAYGDCRIPPAEARKRVRFEGEETAEAPKPVPRPARPKSKPNNLPGDFKFREEE